MAFNTAKPKVCGYFWMQNVTTFNEPEIVIIRPVEPGSNELGFLTYGGAAITPLNSPTADLMQWQPVALY